MRDELPIITDAKREAGATGDGNWMDWLSDKQLQSLIRTQRRKVGILALSCVALLAILVLMFTAYRQDIEAPISWLVAILAATLVLNYLGEVIVRVDGAKDMRHALAHRQGLAAGTIEPKPASPAAQGTGDAGASAPRDRRAP